MCNKAVCTYPSAVHFVPDRHKTKEMCDKTKDKNIKLLTENFNQDKNLELLLEN